MKIFSSMLLSAGLLVAGTTFASPVKEGADWTSINECSVDSPNYMLARTSMVMTGCLISKNGVYAVLVRELQSFSVQIRNAPGALATNDKGQEFQIPAGATRAVTYWNSGDKSPNSPNTTLDLNDSGTLAVYNRGIAAGGSAQWTSGTGGSGADILIIADWGELVLQRGYNWSAGNNPDLNKGGHYKKRFVDVDRNKFVKGFGGVHTPTVGMYIFDYDTDRITRTTTQNNFENAQSAHASVLNCGADKQTNLTGSQTLGGSITETRSFSSASSSTATTGIEVKVGIEAGAEILKTSVETSVKRELSNTSTTERSSSTSREKHFSVVMNFDVPPGHRQTAFMTANEVTTDIPYTAAAIVQPAGYGRYITRNVHNDVYTNKSGREATLAAGQLIVCN